MVMVSTNKPRLTIQAKVSRLLVLKLDILGVTLKKCNIEKIVLQYTSINPKAIFKFASNY